MSWVVAGDRGELHKIIERNAAAAPQAAAPARCSRPGEIKQTTRLGRAARYLPHHRLAWRQSPRRGRRIRIVHREETPADGRQRRRRRTRARSCQDRMSREGSLSSSRLRPRRAGGSTNVVPQSALALSSSLTLTSSSSCCTNIAKFRGERSCAKPRTSCCAASRPGRRCAPAVMP